MIVGNICQSWDGPGLAFKGGIIVKMTRKIALILVLLVLTTVLILPATANNQETFRLAEPAAASQPVTEERTASGNSRYMPTQTEIQAKWRTVTTSSTVYEEAPSVTAPYAAGKLTDEFLQSGLTLFNYIRFVAGLPEVTLDEDLTDKAQHGAVVMAAIDELTHYPHQPSDMDYDFYSRGYAATTSSNIGWNWGYDPEDSIQVSVNGCIDDSHGFNNLSCVGHRRWILNPPLSKIGFGFAQSLDGGNYVANTVHDRSGAGCDFEYIAWPVDGNHPTNLFGAEVPWSVSLNQNVYQAPSLNNLQITITRESDGKQWSFDKNTGSPVGDRAEDAYMTVNNDWYGVPYCIIFHPGSNNVDEYLGKFHVEISGIYLRNGQATTLSYDVNFFDVNNICEQHIYTSQIVPPTCAEQGYTLHTCTNCGYNYQDSYVPVGDHTYGAWIIIQAPTCQEAGTQQRFCQVCGHCETGVAAPIGHYVLQPGTELVDPCTMVNDPDDPFTLVNGWYESTNHDDYSMSTFIIRALYDCQITLEYKVSSEENYDELFIYINSSLYDTISGETGPKTLSTALKQGDEIIIKYGKDVSASSDFDCGFFRIISCPQVEVEGSVQVPVDGLQLNCAEPVVCAGCGQVVRPATSHDWDEGVVTIEPTAEAEGQRTFTCRRCGATRTEAIPVLEEELLASGPCGEQGSNNVTYKLYPDGRMVITGNGHMGGYHSTSQQTYAPWYDLREHIQTVTIKDGVLSVGAETFKDCSNLETVTLPDGLITINTRAFSGCSSLQEITLPDSLVWLHQSVFYGCSSLKRIVIPEGISKIDTLMFEDCSSLEEVVLPGSVTSIGYRAFKNCTSLKAITLPAGLTVLDASAFYGCSSLENIDIPDGVTGIGAEAFRYCSNLEDITLPANLVSIGSSAFEGCTSLNNIQIPETVTSIGSRVFYECSSLEEITIPEGVDEIPQFAFYKCTNLKRATLPEHASTIGNNAFYECVNLEQINTVFGLETIGYYAFCKCEKLKLDQIPGGVDTISMYAFAYCSGLETLNLPSVATVENCAFYECRNLKEITFTEDLSRIDYGAFLYCDSLTDVYFRGTQQHWQSLSNQPVADFIHYNYQYGGYHWNPENQYPDCVNGGHTHEVCPCGYERNCVDLAPLGHNWGEGHVIYEPTYTLPGMRVYVCSRCAEYREETIPPLGGEDDTVIGDAMIGDQVYESILEALEAAYPGCTIVLTNDVDATGETLILRPGVTLHLGAYDLIADGFIGFNGSILDATRYSATGDYGKLIVPKENLVLSGGQAAVNGEYDVIPVWNGEDAYILANALVNDTEGEYGLKIDEENKTIRFSFVHKVGGSANNAFFKDGTGDNALKIIIRLEWASGNGVAYQDFVYNDDFVGLVSGGGYNYSFILNNYDILNIDISNLKVTAMILTDAGTITTGQAWTQANAIE